MTLLRTLRLPLLAAAALLFARDVNAQGARTVVLRFRKAGDTVAIRNAQITIDHSIEAGLTDSLGMIRIPDLEDGGHIVEALATGYQAFFDKFKSGPDIRMPIDLEILAVIASAKIKSEPTELRFADFAKRRALGQGKFFTLAQLKAAAGRPLSNFLKLDAGAFIATGPHNESFLASRTAPRAAPCYAAVVRDGLRIFPIESASPPDLDKIFTDDLGSIEFYSAISPAGLGVTSKCGTLVLWSRP